ncbi:hypothetical protein LQ757_00645 [Agromyces sp. SYSU K20354]|uniref:hypothetical protein n=1 Tax=Agromyces cavernae TaxID=2898659 RepID=UPI001E619956|nr:hypothetical protein [Agromyces cavernae]MCD2440776.1 hypothetical protein [Agromyces cavernae]
MTWIFWSLVFGSMAAGLVLAIVWWLIRGRRDGLPTGLVAAFSLVAGLTALSGDVALRLISVPLLPFDLLSGFWGWYADYRFTFPLLLGVLTLVILAIPVRGRGGHGAAELAPRTPLSFGRRWWFISPLVVLTIILVTTVIAGFASQPDPEGRYSMYYVELGTGGMGASIYGWFYSVPCLILTAVVIGVTVTDLTLIARPALAEDMVRDVRERKTRTRNVLAVATGTLLLHLGLIFSSLAGTASARASFPVDGGSMTFWTSFAALQPVFTGASYAVAALGYALWATVLLSAIPTRRPAPVPAR